MSRTFKEPYSSLYEEYAEHERTRLSRQGFASCMGRTGMLVEWLEERKLMPDDVGIIQAMEFIGDVSKRTGRSGHPVTQGTICNYIKSARRFYGYLVESEAAASNPFMEVEYPRVPEHLSRNVLTEGQMFSLLEGLGKFNRGSTKRERSRLYVCHVLAELMYSTGLRIDEASSLEAGDVNLKSRMVYVRRGKGGRSRTAFLSGFAAEVLRECCEHYRYKYSQFQQVFLMRKGGIAVVPENREALSASHVEYKGLDVYTKAFQERIVKAEVDSQ